MKRHALFAGVNNYNDKSIRQLRYSIPDASVLEDRFKGLGYMTRLLSDPSEAELKEAVEESVAGLGRGDVFLFFFAGHGFTAQDGAHLLFCRDSRQKLLRVNGSGVKVNALEALTDDGGFHRAFLLDSCRTDCLAGMEGRGGGATRDLDFVAMPECTEESGSYFLLRSCDKFRPSLEFDKIGHGLFTQGLLDAMAAHDNRLAFCDTSFAEAIRVKMVDVQRTYNVTDLQRPSLGECSGPVFSLFDKDFLDSAAEHTVDRTGDVKTLVLPGGAKMEMIYCDHGEFLMGSPESEEGRAANEKRHRVRLTRGFWLGKSPVTQEQWQSVMGSNPSYFCGNMRLPVESVSWNMCRAFVEKVAESVRRQFGGEARLPTEAEWEYACRAGTTTAYCWGNALNGDKANCDGSGPYGTTRKGTDFGKTTPVGCYDANAWGFLDMHGNVWEWCADWYGDYDGDAEDPIGPHQGRYRVLRGGCWKLYARNCRAAIRNWFKPNFRNAYCGFRLSCSANEG